MPSIIGTSVCGRGAIHSPFSSLQVSVRIGSILITFVPAFFMAATPGQAPWSATCQEICELFSGLQPQNTISWQCLARFSHEVHCSYTSSEPDT